MLIYSGAHDQAVCIGLVTVCMMMSCIGFESCQVCFVGWLLAVDSRHCFPYLFFDGCGHRYIIGE